MKTLKLSTIATMLCLLCMSMGFPNLASEEEEDDSKENKSKARTTSVRKVALACSRQINVAEKPSKGDTEKSQPSSEKASPCTITAKLCSKKTA